MEKKTRKKLFRLGYVLALVGVFFGSAALMRTTNMRDGKATVEVAVKKEKVSEQASDLSGFSSYFDRYIEKLNTASGYYYDYPYYKVKSYSEDGDSYFAELSTRRVDKLKGLGSFDYGISDDFFKNDKSREENLAYFYEGRDRVSLNRVYPSGVQSLFTVSSLRYSLKLNSAKGETLSNVDAEAALSKKGNRIVHFNLIDLPLVDSISVKVDGSVRYFSSLWEDEAETKNVVVEKNKITIYPVTAKAIKVDKATSDNPGGTTVGDFGLYLGYVVYRQNMSRYLISGFIVLGILTGTILYFGIAQKKFQDVFSRKNVKKVLRFKTLYALIIPAAVLLVLFRYLPMLWLSAGFMDYRLLEGLNSEWVGPEYFVGIFLAKNTPEMYRIFRNTIFISLIRILTNLPFILVLALLINSMKRKRPKTLFQGLTMIPYFLSWVAVGGLFYSLLNSETGLVNRLFALTTDWYSVPEPWWALLSLSSLWKGMGWSALIYIAAMCQIDPEQYEAARIDGCGPIRQAFTVTLPGIMNVICLQLILDISNLMRDNFDQIYAMTNGKITSTISQTVDVVGRISYTSLLNSNFGSATAIGLIQGVIGCVLVVFANHIVKKTDNEGIM